MTDEFAPIDDDDIEEIAVAWMKHLGYSDAEIEEAENLTCQKAGCKYIRGYGYNHEDYWGKSLHPIQDELLLAAENALFVIDALAKKGKLK